MKRVVELCSKGPDGRFMNDAVKLRLRGHGSGYKEGPYNRGNLFLNFLESDEPLHLCISSKFHDRYQKACNLVQELIAGVYDDFKLFCQKSGKQNYYNLNVQREESISSQKCGQTNYAPLIKDNANFVVNN